MVVVARRDWGGDCDLIGGPGVRLTVCAFASMMRDVTLSALRKDVSLDARNRPVRWMSAIPFVKSGRKPTQFAMDPAAVTR